MKRIVFDIECLYNFFCVAIIDYDSDKEIIYEISENKNDYEDIVKFFKSIQYGIGFNSVHYDNLLINYLLRNYKELQYLNYSNITAGLYQLSILIIEDKEGLHKDLYKQYTQFIPYRSIDLFLYWSRMTRLSKKLSLKSLSANIFWHNIQQIPVKHNEPLPKERIEEVKEYCFNDIRITKELAKLLKDNINLRISIENEYDIKCLSSDNIKIASDLLAKQYAQVTGIPQKEFRQKQTIRESVKLRDVILPFIEFDIKPTVLTFDKDTVKCNNYFTLLDNLIGREVSTTKELSYSILTKNPDDTNLMTDIGSGGVHGLAEGTIFQTTKDNIIIESDVASLYPTLGSEFGFIPEHLDKRFLFLYKDIKEKRMKAKKEGNKVISEAFKLVLNGKHTCRL